MRTEVLSLDASEWHPIGRLLINETQAFVHIQMYDAAAGLLTVLAGVPRGWGSVSKDLAFACSKNVEHHAQHRSKMRFVDDVETLSNSCPNWPPKMSGELNVALM